MELQYCVIIPIFLAMLIMLLCRDSSEPDPHHGQAGAGSVYALPAGDGEGWPGGGNQ